MGDERLEIREDILKKVTSPEAERVTPELCTIFLRLVRAPQHLWEGENVLRLAGEMSEGRRISAWDQLIALGRVSPRTMRQVVAWLVSEGVIQFSTTHDRSEIGISISFEGVSSSGSDR